MIPAAHITHWAAGAPWPTELQIEQDLVLSRLIVEIARHPLLGSELAFRGGTCLHKLHLPTALRYSEDLDYVRSTKSGIKEILAALREVCGSAGLVEKDYRLVKQMATIVFVADAEAGGRMRVKVETNIAETEPYGKRIVMPYAVASPWFSGEADVLTFSIDELTATKFRALYQRRKGRDLFDLWHTVLALPVDDAVIVDGLRHYMGDATFTFPQLAQNLAAKLADDDFNGDLASLVRETPTSYDPVAAADVVMERLGVHLKNAPPSDRIAGGAWRGT